jgi:hypothetical protein
MTWETLNAVRTATRCEFSAALAARHVFVRLLSGRWGRCLDAPPLNAVHVRGNVYHLAEGR